MLNSSCKEEQLLCSYHCCRHGPCPSVLSMQLLRLLLAWQSRSGLVKLQMQKTHVTHTCTTSQVLALICRIRIRTCRPMLQGLFRASASRSQAGLQSAARKQPLTSAPCCPAATPESPCELQGPCTMCPLTQMRSGASVGAAAPVLAVCNCPHCAAAHCTM